MDTIQIPGPYIYKIYRGTGLNAAQPVLIDSLLNINDTLYTDSSTGLNTVNNALSYRIELINNSPGQRFLVGFTQWASSVFLSASGSDNAVNLSWEENVPWINNSYNIYRYNEANDTFELIGQSDTQSFSDSPIANKVEYCYKVESIGDYTVDGLISPIINFSQEICAEAVDNEPPCPPVLTIDSDCESGVNTLTWTNPNNFCADDAMSYNVYFKAFIDDEFVLLTSVNNLNDTVFVHIRENTVAGCYSVTAIDSFMNESSIIAQCVDNCPVYELPNVFTPNGDGFNDLFRPFPYRQIESINIIIYNRWGQLVFESNNPEINWNGNDLNGNPLPDGVYFYVCEVNEILLAGINKRILKGNIHIIDRGIEKIN
jgi:gliding motility-associated-like protein